MEIPVLVSPGDSQAVCYTAALPQNSALATRQTSKWVLLVGPPHGLLIPPCCFFPTALSISPGLRDFFSRLLFSAVPLLGRLGARPSVHFGLWHTPDPQASHRMEQVLSEHF